MEDDEGGGGGPQQVDLATIPQDVIDAENVRRGNVVLRHDDPRLSAVPIQQQAQAPKKEEEDEFALDSLKDIDDSEMMNAADVKKILREYDTKNREKLSKIPDQAFATAEKSLRQTQVALDGVKGALDTEPGLPPEERQRLFKMFAEMPTSQIDECIKTGAVQELAQAAMYRLLKEGKITQQQLAEIPNAAPTGGAPKNKLEGVRGRMDADQLEAVAAQEASMGIEGYKFTDDKLIAMGFGH